MSPDEGLQVFNACEVLACPLTSQGFGGLGGLGFWGLRVVGFGLLGFRVVGLWGFRVLGFRVLGFWV